MERSNADRGLSPGFLALRAKRFRHLSSPWSSVFSVSLWFDSTLDRARRDVGINPEDKAMFERIRG